VKKPRNKKYRPRPVAQAGAPLAGDQLADLSLVYWLSLEQLRTGDAAEEAWSPR